jgi:methylisocitrate lyase
MSTRKRFRELIARGRLVPMPGAYDALSAKIMEAEGFDAIIAGGYAAIGSMMGQADMGQCNVRDYADHYARICAAVSIPVYVDGDTGFGGVHNVREMVRAFEAAGVAGLFFSDQVFPNRCGYLPGKQIVPVEQMLARVEAALDARRDADMLIVARTDAAGVEGVEAAIARCRLFMAAGADAAKPQGIDAIADIRRVIAEVPGPHFATISQAAGPKHRSLTELEEAGVATVSFPRSRCSPLPTPFAMWSRASSATTRLRGRRRADGAPRLLRFGGPAGDDGAGEKLRPRRRRPCQADRRGVMHRSVAESPRRPKIGVAHHHCLPQGLTLP